VQRIFVHQVILDSQGTGVVQILLSCWSIGFERLNDPGFSLVERLLAGFLDV